MGNTVVKCCVAGEGIVRIMTVDGDVEEFEWPISAGEVMERHPGYLVLDTTHLESKEKNHGGHHHQQQQGLPNQVGFMPHSMALQPGRLYVLCTVPTTPPPQSTTTSIPLHVKNAAAPVSSSVPASPPEVAKSHTYSFYDSQASPAENVSSSESQLEDSSADDDDDFERFTPTFRRRRSSVIIASDILHSFQVKKDAAVDGPAVPEPKEPRGHSWSPSLSSIPESPANSLRVADPPSSGTNHLSGKTTPPRHSTNINKLVKQAILHKHPRSFWR